MDCRAYCTAAAYRIKSIHEAYRNLYKVTAHRDVIHLEISISGGTADLFIFTFGSCVFWGFPKEFELEILKEIHAYEETPLDEIETDEFTYVYGAAPKIVEDEITLPNQDVLTKLALSYGLAQSVKLGTFEIATQKTFNSTKYIPDDLAKRGKISLSRREIRKKMGELFIERNSINLHVDVLDTPEFFWEHSELEPLYRTIASYLDIETRVEVLNHRLDVVHELFGMLGSELNHQHSSRLEITIILLIVIEVILSLMRDVFRIL